MPKPSDFRLEEFDVPDFGKNDVLVRVKYLSLDPYMRCEWATKKSHRDELSFDVVLDHKSGSVNGFDESSWQNHQR